jgi:predicted nuclease with TOPRIM domain
MAAPVKNTCPDINRAIKRLETIKEHMNDMVKSIEYELSEIEDSLEELRSDNSALRDWGTENESRVKELEDEVYELESKLELQNA